MAQNFRKVFTVRDGIQVSGESLVVANNRVGIGTSTPSRQAEVVGELLVSGKLGNTGVVSFRNLELAGITTFYEFDSDTGYKGLGAGTTNPGTVIGIGTSYAGIQTGATMQIGYGITFFANTGRLEAVAYHGDGSTLSNVPISGWTSTSDQPPALVAANTADIYRLANVGIGTTIVTHRLTVKTGNFDGRDIKGNLWVDNDGYFGGIVTATSYRGDLSLMSGIAQTAGFARTAFGLQGDPTIGITTLTALGAATINGKVAINTSINHEITGAGISITGIVTSIAGFAGSLTGDVTGDATGLRLEPSVVLNNMFARTVGVGSTNTGIAVTTNGGVLIDGLLDPTGNTYGGISTVNEPPNYHLFLRNIDDKNAATIGMGFGVGMGDTAGAALVYEQTGNEGGNISVYTRNSTSARVQRRFTVGQEGNVGVGTSRPGKSLAVIGDAEIYGQSEFIGSGVSFTDGANLSIDIITGGSNSGILTGLKSIRSVDSNYLSGFRNLFGLTDFRTSTGIGVSITEGTGVYAGRAKLTINPSAVSYNSVYDDTTFCNGGSTFLGYQGAASKLILSSDSCIAFSTSNYLKGIVLDLTPYYSTSTQPAGVTTGFTRLPVNFNSVINGIFQPGVDTEYEGLGFFGLESHTSSYDTGKQLVYTSTKIRTGLGTTSFGLGVMYDVHPPLYNASWIALPTTTSFIRQISDGWMSDAVGIASGQMFFDIDTERVAYSKYQSDPSNNEDFPKVFSSEDVFTLIGIATVTNSNPYQLGTFTGSTISNNTTIKNALQELETEVEDRRSFSYRTGTNSADADLTVNAANIDRYFWSTTFGGDRTLQISNLTSGREVIVFIRELGNVSQIITVNASTTTSGYSAVALANSLDAQSDELNSFTLGGGGGLADGLVQVRVINIGGNFVGSVVGNE